MARPKNCREIADSPGASYYKPAGIPYSSLEEIIITLDEFEAVRLADYEGLYQQVAAEKMGVSRQTFGRIVESAHKKIADAFVNGKALRIDGGDVKFKSVKPQECEMCRKNLSRDDGAESPASCQDCDFYLNKSI